jgi:predicted flavoprotein YhiN
MKTKMNLIGPASCNSYSFSDNINNREFGKSVLSQFRNSTKRSFTKSLRIGIIDKEKGKTPGPKYCIFSEFGTKKM